MNFAQSRIRRSFLKMEMIPIPPENASAAMDSPYAVGCRLVWLALLMILTYAFFHVIWLSYCNSISHIPGPWLARFSNFWMVKQTLGGGQHLLWARLHEKYGPLVRIGPTTVLVSDPKSFRVIFGPGTKFAKAEEYEAFDLLPGIPHIFSVRDQKSHSLMRKRIARAYASNTIVQMEDRFDKSLHKLLDCLRKFAESSETFDLAFWVTLFTFDTLGDVGFSRSFNLLSTGTDRSGIVHAVQRTTPLLIAFSHVPSLVKLVRSKLVKSVFGQPAGAAFLEKYVREIMGEKSSKAMYYAKGNKPVDMLDHIMHSQNPDGSPISLDEAFVEAELIFFAGADTIASSIRVIIYYLTKNNDSRARLQQEIDTFRARGALSTPPRFRETCSMPYLMAVVKEAQRICPAASAKFMRSVPEGGIHLAGAFLPSGTSVGSNSWVMHHNKEVFGIDADEFCPDRWLDDADAARLMTSYDFGFGMGARECAGKHVALVEIQKAIVQLFDHFEFDMACLDTPWREENYGIVFQKDMHVRVRLRQGRMEPK